MLVAASVTLAAQTVRAASAERDLRTEIEQRVVLTRNYLQSETAAGISENGLPQARKLLQKATELLEQASTALEQGSLAAAEEKINLALQAFTAAAAANARKSVAAEQLASGNESIRAEIEAYLGSFNAALAEKGPAMAGLLDRDYLAELLSRAEQAQSLGDYANARSVLQQARQMTVAALIKIRNNETVVYTIEFQTPADEFRYERERYQEYAALGQRLLDSGELDSSRILMFEQLKQNGDRLNQEAESLAAEGDYRAAIGRMETAVKKLVQGLRLLGIPLSM